MAKCKYCGKWGLFLSLDAAGACINCAAVRRKEFQRRREEAKAKAQAEAAAKLEAVPCAPIEATGERVNKRNMIKQPDFNGLNITARTNAENLSCFVAIDVETTGVQVGGNRIIEVGAVRFENWEPVERFQTLINPGMPIPPDATAINGITDAMVADAPIFGAILPDLHRFIKGQNLVGHNLPFDLSHLWHEGMDVAAKVKLYDTLHIAKIMLRPERNAKNGEYDVADHKLGTLCDYYDIPRIEAHRALGDAYDAGRLLKALYDDKMSR